MKQLDKILIIMGSDSDFPVIEKGIGILEQFGVEYQVIVSSAHRTPNETKEYIVNAEKEGFGVIIAAAGMAAHLPGVCAAFTHLPIIGLPIKSGALAGNDALLSIAMMPPGVPVAAMAIDGSKNAVLYAIQILSIASEDLRKKMIDYKKDMASQVIEKNKKLSEKLSQ